MGTSKQLLRLGNKSVIRHCVDTLAAAGIRDIIVVTGAWHDACVKELQGSSATIVRNMAENSEMADSVRIGLRTLDSSCTGALVCLVDHPLVTVSTYRALLNAHERAPEKIIIPAFNHRRGHPGLFPLPVVSEIVAVNSLRDIVRKDDGRVRIIDVSDEGVVLDMDTKEEYQAILARYGERAERASAGEHNVQ